MHKSTVIHVFIDASNLRQIQIRAGEQIDFRKLVSYIAGFRSMSSVRCYYYTAHPANGTRDYSLDGRYKFYTFLKKRLGFKVRSKVLKRINISTGNGKAVIEKGNMDVELTIDAVYTIAKYDIAVLISGDSDFLSLVRFIQAHDKQALVMSSRGTISSELRTAADQYIDIREVPVWQNK